MSSLRLATASNVRAFQNLSDALNENDGGWAIDAEALEDEIGRFRVWSGNLGALQKGHSSLDYRLRDSPLLSSNALKLLEELADNVNEAYAIVSGARLPYEAQAKPDESEGEEDDDGFFSEEEDDDDSREPRCELKMRFEEMVDIIDNLYKLSVRIRTPTIRSRSLKAASYAPKDPDTGVDVLSTYAGYDLQHVQELLSNLRQPYLSDDQDEQDFLTARLGAAVTLRRRQFKYWKRHRDKLAASAIPEDIPEPLNRVAEGPILPPLNDVSEAPPVISIIKALREAPSQKTGKTLLSGTEATHYHQSLDEIVDNKSVTSYAVTVKDIHGRGVELPPPPKTANDGKDFECPYCYIICPARYGRGRPWRTHLLQDLQPYSCTYPVCDSSQQLFRSRREWAEHEASHRKVWRCAEHPEAVYTSPTGLENHLRQKHLDSFPESQVGRMVELGETSTVDARLKCPICYASADTEGLGDFQSHIANHLERIATFALPHGIEDDSESASSAANRGRSTSSGSQHMSEMSLPSDSTDEQFQHDDIDTDTRQATQPPNLVERLDPGRTLLSAESLQQLPDESQNRVNMIPNKISDPNDSEDEGSDLASDQAGEAPADIEAHLDQRETFRKYMLSLPGAEAVRFYRRYGSWTGQVTFKDDAAGVEAMKLFDTAKFPNVKFQSKESKSKWKFSAQSNNGSLSRQSTTDTLGNEITHIGSRGYIPYEGEDEKSSKQPVLSVSDIPTLRSLYRSSRLLQRDQSYAPNDSYNRMISFCYHDLTRLKVDAIVNSSNLNVAEATDRLDRAVHKAGGPELTREARSKAKLKPGQVELTHGHALPCSWVIHAARPTYAALGSMGTFNILTECYRSALKMAGNYEMKTLAFPCIGTGLSGFPPRVAARIALQEVREYLEAHTDYRFERIVFCVNSAADEKAYMDFFPVFFPPTHGDLDRARTSDWSANRAALAAQILETRAQVQKVRDETIAGFSRTMPVAVNIVTTHLGRIDDRLSSIRGFLLGPQELKRSLGDLNLLCSVLLTVCGSIKEMIELSKDTMNSERTPEDIWKDNDAHMLDRHEVSLTQFLDECWIFAVSLDKVLTEAVPEIENVAAIRQRLESYGVKQKGQDSEGIRDHLDEVLYVREFQRGAASYGRHIVKLPHNSSVAKLYLLGELETKQTLAKPSVIFNEAVCLVREDITRLEVDVMVNSTDSSFLGMGTLDRTVLKKGGTGLQEEVKKFGKCNEGDVLLTPGYLLPAKHILHVIPPEQYRKNTKDILRKIYREVLHTALQMKATSVAIPSIGTGMLNYPRRDCASLAMEEVKRFLESAEPTNLIEKIVFVVYSSNDEFIYKSLLPIYFPPPQQVGPSRSVAQPTEVQGSSQLSKTTPTPRRSLFGSVGDALRGVRFGKQPETSRLINSYEEHALIEFERHAKYCITCKDIEGLYVKGRDLCDVGYRLAQTLLRYMDMLEDGHVYSMQGAEGKRDKVEVPSDIFPFSLRLLRTVERSSRDKDRKGLFVTQDHEFAAPPPELVQRKYDESAVSTVPDKDVIEQPAEPLYEPPAKIRAEVYTWKDDGVSSNWMPICIDFSSFVQVYNSRIDVHGPKYDKGDKNNETVLPNDIPILSLDLTSVETILRRESPKGVVIWGIGKKFASPFRGPVLFKTIHTAESDVLFGAFQRAINRTRQDVPLPKEMFGFTDSYAQWNQKLHNIQSQLVIKKQEGEQQSDTQSIVPDPSGGASKFGYSSTSLAAQILDYLTTDLKIRPGSYIGQRTNKIAFVLNKDPVAISASLQDLAAHQQVHNTIDGDTWVLSRSPTELPVLSQQSAERRKPDIYLLAAQVLSFMEHMDRTPTERKGQTVRELASALQLPTSDVWAAIRHLTARRQIHCPSDEETWVVTPQSGKATSQTQDVAHDTAPNVESTSPNEDATSASSLSERALSYLQRLEKAPGRGEHISDLASGLNTSIAELESVLPNLRDEGMVKNTDGNSYWAAALEPNTHQRDPGQSSSWVPSITLTQRTVENDYSDKEVVFSEVLKPSFTGNTLQSDVVEDPYYEPPPFNPGLEWTPQLDVYSDDIWHYVSFPASPDEGKKWTRIDKRIVDPQVMDGVVFEVLERNLLVQAELSMEQIHDLVEMTRARRMGKGKGKMDDEIVDQQPLLRSIAPNPPGSSGNKPARSSDAYPTPVPELDLSQVSAESIDLRAFVFRGIQDSRLNDQWHGQFTNIDIRLVDPEVLYDVGMAFEVQEQYVVVHGHLSEEGIRVLIEKSGTCKGDLSEPVTSYEASHTESKNVTVRDAAGFTDTPPSPTAEHYRHEDLIPDSTLRFDDNIRLGRSAVDARLLSDMIEDIDASGTSAISGTRWTRIDQRLVDARVLEEAGEDFENRGDNLILHRVLRRGEIEKWAEDTMRMRGQQESQDDATGEPEGPAPSLIEAMYEHFGGMVEFMRASNFDRRVKGMWTRIDRRLVDTWALMKVGEEFELLEEASVRNSAVSLLVHRVVGLEEIKAWAEETDEIRAVQDQENLMVGKEEEAEDLGESPEQTSAAGAEPEAGKPSRTERGDLNTRISRQPKKRGESWRDGRGEKDRQQAKLDRILAGDMKEDEQRHYRDSNSDSDTPPSPIQQPCHIVSDEGTEDAAPILDLDTINIKDYYDNDYTKSRSHGRWTRVDKRLVDEQILIEAGEEFHDGGEVFYVHRVLRRVEVELFAEQTRARRDVLRELWENARPRSPAQRPIEPPSDDEDSKVGMKKRFGLE